MLFVVAVVVAKEVGRGEVDGISGGSGEGELPPIVVEDAPPA